MVQGDGLNCYQDNLYFVSKDVSAAQTDPNDYLWKTSLSGETVRKSSALTSTRSFRSISPSNTSSIRGSFYLIGYAYIVQGGKGLTRLSVLSTTLDDSGTFHAYFPAGDRSDIKYPFVSSGTASSPPYKVRRRSSATTSPLSPPPPSTKKVPYPTSGRTVVSEDGTVYLAGADDDAGYV